MKNGTGFALGDPFVRPHPSAPHLAVFVRPVLENPHIPIWKKEIWRLVFSLITILNRQWAGDLEEFSVSISRLDTDEQFVKWHVDSHDVCRQIAVFLGDFTGASLRLYSERGDYTDVVLQPGVVIKLDGWPASS